MRKVCASVATVVTLVIGAGAWAVPAGAQGNSGLIVIDITNVLNNNTILSNNNVQVAVPVTAAANICGVNVAVLAALAPGGSTTCTAQNGNTGVVQRIA